ncbi:unnamed protein product [Didymodactylos carnosus]|uniref:TIR domain-containing protein n=1 Tax=Didymodactylos carnosus TaxID=1234261 RepID=A0A814HTX1_9BILA|nr:unnamed protein product [Didymodactylos carnosus]CAF1015905.1 unnamed protein product [Didymodactylos carnosus]CAF3654633.1 unnamed protein product [Didymodactylos carnosus]CAF3787557.1 unnamed protein product [Didymodactylos carnosus]
MVVALLLEPEEIKQGEKTTNSILDQIFDLTIAASKTATLRTDNFHISEYLVVLTKLFVNDDVVDYILKHAQVKNFIQSQSRVQFFCNLLVSVTAYDQSDVLLRLTCITLFNILWSTSFNDKYKTELKENERFVNLVKSTADKEDTLVENDFQKHLSSIKKAADGILFNLSLENITKTVKSNVTANTTFFMISYSHADTAFCKQLTNALQQTSMHNSFWVDFLNIKNRHGNEEAHTDDLWEEIAEAIEKASAIILLVSKNYYDSKSCRQELAYAKDMQKKRIIPIFVQKDYKPTGWLGIRVAGLAYIDFNKKLFNDALKELYDSLSIKSQELSSSNDEGKDHKATETAQKQLFSSTALDKPTAQWSSDAVNFWFEENRIDLQLRALLDFQNGEELLVYAEELKSNFDREQRDTRARFEKQYGVPLNTVQFIRFKQALYRLHGEQHPAEQKIEASNPPVSFICSIM